MMQSKQQKQFRLNRYGLVSDLLLEDKEDTGLTESQIAEKILLDHYMPDFGYQVVVDIYENRITLNQALQQIWISAMRLEVLKRVKLQSVVTFMMNVIVLSNPYISMEQENYHILILQIDSLMHFFDRQVSNFPDKKLKEDYKFLSSIVELYRRKEEDFNSAIIISLISSNWVWLCEYDLVFSLLNNILSMLSDIKMTSNMRRELREILKRI